MLRPERTEFAVNLSVLFTALHNGQVIREHNDENQGSSNDMCRDARNPTTHSRIQINITMVPVVPETKKTQARPRRRGHTFAKLEITTQYI
jgi:hypothetical protein